jgi:NTE family protein
MADVRTGLVLAGGGVAGIAWELGVLEGLADADPDLASAVLSAELVVGTSAGSSVGAQITSGTPLSELYDAQLAPRSAEIPVDLDLQRFIAELQAAMTGATSAAELRQRICAFALRADTVPEADRLAVMAARLPRHEWPDRDLRVVAVDTTTADRTVFTRDSGVGLVDAVAASWAVPGVWPPVTVGDRRYVDGGVWSGANADLATGVDRVLVLSPTPADAPSVLGRPLPDELAELTGAGVSRVHVVHADDASVAAFGTNPLAATTRTPSALAGRHVGRAAAAAVARTFSA